MLEAGNYFFVLLIIFLWYDYFQWTTLNLFQILSKQTSSPQKLWMVKVFFCSTNFTWVLGGTCYRFLNRLQEEQVKWILVLLLRYIYMMHN